MAVENISWSISTKECCRPRRGLNLRPRRLHVSSRTTHPTEPPRPSQINLVSLAIQNAPSEDSDQTACMPRLIWVYAGCTCPVTFSDIVAQCIYHKCLDTFFYIFTILIQGLTNQKKKIHLPTGQVKFFFHLPSSNSYLPRICAAQIPICPRFANRNRSPTFNIALTSLRKQYSCKSQIIYRKARF